MEITVITYIYGNNSCQMYIIMEITVIKCIYGNNSYQMYIWKYQLSNVYMEISVIKCIYGNNSYQMVSSVTNVSPKCHHKQKMFMEGQKANKTSFLWNNQYISSNFPFDKTYKMEIFIHMTKL